MSRSRTLPTPSRRRFLAAASTVGAAALAAGPSLLLTGCGDLDRQSSPSRPDPNRGFGGTLLDPPFTKPDVTLVDLDGEPFPFVEATAGELTVLFFGYTNCPDICPAGLQTISAALDKLGEKADRLTPLFISVDPERDTPAVLGEYVKSFHPKIVGLTGSVEEADQAAKAYKVYHKKVELEGSAAGYAIDHSGIIYLMDANGEYLKHFQHNVTIDALAEAIGNKL